MKFWPSYMKGRRLRSMKKSEFVKSAKGSKSVSKSTKEGQDKKNSKDPGRSQRYKEHFQYQISEEANLHPQNQEQSRRKQSKRDRESQMLMRNYMKICTKVKKATQKKGMDSRIEDDEKDPDQHNSIPEFTKNKIQNAIDRLKKKEAKNNNGIRAEQLKNCSDDTKKQDNLQRNFAARRRHTKKLAKDPNPGHLQRR